jgi:hypothetical protein
MIKDLEYLLVNTEGAEEIIFSAKTMKEIARFCKKDYSDIRRCYNKETVFRFDNQKVKIISVDLNMNYEVEDD